MDHPVNFNAALDYIQQQYSKLTHLTIDTDLIKFLFMEQVVTHKEKKEIQRWRREERMEYLLDNIIIPSLEIEFGQKYINLINVMDRSDDILLKTIASELKLQLYD